MLKATDERRAKIADGLAASDRAEKALLEANQEVEKQIKAARDKAGEIVEQANQRHSQILDQAKEDATGERHKQVAAGEAEKIMDHQDPGLVVIDEIVGMLITMIAVPATPLAMVLGFILFRIFDILKPFPVNFFDQRFHGGLGIMLDDVMAGIYSLIILQVLFRFVF